MRFAVLGATGPTGLQIVQQALQRGHEVVAAVRSPERLGELRQSEGLTVKTVNIFKEEDLVDAFQNCDAVFSALGAKSSFFSRITLMTESGPIIVAAMRKAGVKRLAVVTSQCTVYSPEHSKFIEWFLKPLFIGRNLDDMARFEQYLSTEECNDIEYTVVKPPGLQNKPLDPNEPRSEEGQFVRGTSNYQIPRANVAKFMLDSVDNHLWVRKLVAIQY